MSRALTIAGSDSSGGAGIQADLKVFAELGVYGLSAVTAVTAQDSSGVQKVNSVPQRIVAAQIDCAVRDIGVNACKIGMLYSPQTVSAVAGRISRREVPNVVLDPVIISKNGTRLLLSKGIYRMRRFLIPSCTVVTPNLDEAQLLTGLDVTDIGSAQEAARKLHGFGARYVLVKGGHLAGEAVDILFDGDTFTEYRSERVEGRNMHGTGCVLSAAIAAYLARGEHVPAAVGMAKEYVTAAIKNSVKLGKGGLWYFQGAGPVEGPALLQFGSKHQGEAS